MKLGKMLTGQILTNKLGEWTNVHQDFKKNLNRTLN